MSETWLWKTDGKLYFIYRSRKWDENRYHNFSEVTAVTATCYDPSGNVLSVAQQPSWVPAQNGWVGYVLGSDLATYDFVTVKLVPTLAPGVNANWAPTRMKDISVADLKPRGASVKV